MKMGHLELAYFKDKFGIDPATRFASVLAKQQAQGFLTFDPLRIEVTLEGLLQVDQLLPDFFLDVHRDARYA